MNFREIGNRIKNRRLELKLTQEQLAELIGVTDTYVGAIERATSKFSIETFVKISQALKLNSDYLLFGTTAENIDNRFSQIIKDIPEEKQELFISLCESIAEKLK